MCAILSLSLFRKLMQSLRSLTQKMQRLIRLNLRSLINNQLQVEKRTNKLGLSMILSTHSLEVTALRSSLHVYKRILSLTSDFSWHLLCAHFRSTAFLITFMLNVKIITDFVN